MKHNLDLGQHFLINNDIINIMIDSANLNSQEIVLEIGAGNGILTKELAKKCKQVQVVEIDTRLKTFLDPIASKYTNIKITYDNALDFDFTNIKKIVTSLPYNIIEPFIHKCIRENVEFILMLIGDKYALSLIDNSQHTYLQTLTQTYFSCELIEFVGNENFNPKPKTGSYIVRLIRKTNFNDIDFFFSEMFSQGDKKIKNAIIESIIRLANKHLNICTQKQARTILDKCTLSEKILNAQMSNLNNDEFSNLYFTIIKIIKELLV